MVLGFVSRRVMWTIIVLTLATVFMGCNSAFINDLPARGQDAVPHRVYSLEGNWQFAPGVLLSPQEALDHSGYKDIEVPGNFAHRIAIGTYLLDLGEVMSTTEDLYLLLPEVNSSYKAFLFDDGLNQIDWAAGVVSPERDSYIPQYWPHIQRLPLQSSHTWLLIQVADFHTLSPGILRAPLLGLGESLFSYQKNNDMLTAAYTGIFLIIGIFFLILSWEDKMITASRTFGLLAIIVALRVLLVDRVIWQWFTTPSELVFEILNRLEILTFYLAVPLIYSVLQGLFPLEITEKIKKPVWIMATIFIVGLFLPTQIFRYMRVAYQLFALLVISYAVVMVFVSAIRKRTGARFAIFSFIFGLGTIINDILLANTIIKSVPLTSYGLLLFILTQAVILSLYYLQIRKTLIKTNLMSSYFVPRELLLQLGFNDITDTKLGVGTEKDMTVLFADIRSYTQLSEGMSPTENYQFLNAYMETLGPVIRDHEGIVDKFIGDGIMALFPADPTQAVRAAQQMLIQLGSFNERRRQKGYVPINIGIGIHSGKVILGTLGEKERMEVTVISDTVNGAARISDITKLVNSTILMSGKTRDLLPVDMAGNFRYLGRFKVKGKEQLLNLYEDNPSLGENYSESEEGKLFHQGINYYFNREFANATAIFDKLLSTNKDDGAILYYKKLLLQQTGSID